MLRRGIEVLILLLVLCVPAIVGAQGLLSFQSMDVLNLGGVEVTPSLKAGYQYMGLDINVPVPFSGVFGPELATASGLDFKLRDAGVWIGGIRVDASRGGYSLFATAEANAIKSARVSTPSDPFWAGEHPVEWRGSRLEWWSIGGGGAIDIAGNMAVIGGFRAEHLSLRLADPVDPTGTIQQFQAQFGDRYSSDLLTKLWVPYFGLREQFLNFTSTVIFSPYTWCDVKIPFRYFFVAVPLLGYEDARYTFKRSGVFLEGTLDYRVQASTNASCTLWFKGNWCQIRGRGNEDYRADATVGGIPVFSFTNSQSASGTFRSYVLAAGLSFLYEF